nr:MAG TPA_asm: hypothetical protein [Caudoviricetes sp.]
MQISSSSSLLTLDDRFISISSDVLNKFFIKHSHSNYLNSCA